MKKIIPFGNRVLVKRDKVGKNAGDTGIVLPDQVADKETELAVVVCVPDHTFIDSILIKDSAEMVNSLSVRVKKDGDSQAMRSLIDFNDYLRIKSIQEGDKVMISKYVGITFNDNFNEGDLTLVDASDIIGTIKDG